MRLALLLLASWCAACQNHHGENESARLLQRMVDQERCAADDTTTYFRNGSCNQPPPAETLAFHAAVDTPEETGRDAHGQPLTAIPMRVDRGVIEQGRGRFELFCATCHGPLGNGESEVAENMLLKRPPALDEPVIQALPDGQLFRIISEGYGLMPSYARSLSPKQRWAVVAYVRVLALSRRMPLALLSPKAREEAERWLR